LFRLIENTRLVLLEGEFVEPIERTSGVPITWRKVKVASGERTGAIGWVPLNNIAQN